MIAFWLLVGNWRRVSPSHNVVLRTIIIPGICDGMFARPALPAVYDCMYRGHDRFHKQYTRIYGATPCSINGMHALIA